MSYWTIANYSGQDIVLGVGIDSNMSTAIQFNDALSAVLVNVAFSVNGHGGSSAVLDSYSMTITVGSATTTISGSGNGAPNYYGNTTLAISGINANTGTTMTITMASAAHGNSGIYTVNLSGTVICQLMKPNPGAVHVSQSSVPNPPAVLMLLTPNSALGSSTQLTYFKCISAPIFFLPTTSATIDDSQNPVTINATQAATLFQATHTGWYIANLYSGNIPTWGGFPLPYALDSSKIMTAQPSTVNIYDIGKPTAPLRLNGQGNLCILPEPTSCSGQMCFIVYGGAGDKSANPLSIQTASGNMGAIDFLSAYPYLSADASYKSTGIVLVAVENVWCILGWYNTGGHAWDNVAAAPGSLTLTPTSVYVLQSANPALGQLILPPITEPVGTARLIVYKVCNNVYNSGFGIVFAANDQSNGLNAVDAGEASANRMYYGLGTGPAYSCYWFVIATLPNTPFTEDVRTYFPLVSYVP